MTVKFTSFNSSSTCLPSPTSTYSRETSIAPTVYLIHNQIHVQDIRQLTWPSWGPSNRVNYKCDTSCRFLFMHDALPFVSILFSLVYISHAIVIMSFFASSHKHMAPIMSCLVGITTCRCNNITILSNVVILDSLFPISIYIHTLFYVLPVSETKQLWVIATVTLDSYRQLSPVPGYIICQYSILIS